MVVILLALLLGLASTVHAQDSPLPPTAAHVVVDACTGCAGVGGGTVVQGVGGVSPWLVNFGGTAQPITVASLPLPTGAATAANQTTGNGSLSSIDGKMPALGQALAASSVPVVLTAAQLTTLTPVSTVTANAGTGTLAVSAASLPLPALAATSTKQSDGTQKTQLVDGAGNAIGATTNALDINIKSGNPTSLTANAGTNLNTSALALEAGHLATIDTSLTTNATNTTALANAIGTAGAALPTRAELSAGMDPFGLVRPVATTPQGVTLVQPAGALPLPPCNPVRRSFCAPKGF